MSLFLSFCLTETKGQNSSVKIKKENNSWYLEVNGRQFYVKGVVGNSYLDWEIRPEAKYAAYAGQGEKVPEPVQGLISGQTVDISFKTPSSSGAYRLFVYVYDRNGHFSTGNLPFYVR